MTHPSPTSPRRGRFRPRTFGGRFLAAVAFVAGVWTAGAGVFTSRAHGQEAGADAPSPPPAWPAAAPPVLPFDSLTPEDGLSQSSVFAIAQDRQGYLWLGTENGLNRWDGKEFRIYRPDPRQPGSLAGALVQDLAVDPRGNLWIATEGGGAARYDPATDAFHHHRHDPADPASLPTDLVSALAFDGHGRLWVATRDQGVHRLRPGGEGFDHFRAQPGDACSLASNVTTALLRDSRGDLWVGTDRGLHRFLPATGCFEPVSLPAAGGSAPRQEISTLYEDRQGRLWIGTRFSGLFHLSPGEAQARHLELAPEARPLLAGAWISDVLEGAAGGLWIATLGRGLHRLDLASGELVTAEGDPTRRGSLGSASIRTLALDGDGTLWVGTEQAGAARLPARRLELGHYRDVMLGGRTESLQSVFSIHLDEEGWVWAGTLDRGLFRFRPGARQAVRLLDSENAEGAGTDRIYAITGGRTGEILVGTSSGRILAVEGGGRRVREVAQLSDGDRQLSVRSLVAEADGSLWAATWRGGLHHLDRRRGEHRVFRHDPQDPASLGEDIVLTLTRDGGGSLWIGTWSQGLNRLDLETEQVERVALSPEGGERVAQILETRSGDLWVCTDRGLFHRPAGGSAFRPHEALAGEVIYGLLEDATGALWAGGDGGLWRLGPNADGEAGDSIEHYQQRDGLQGPELNVGAFDRGPGGELAFGGPGGLNLFHPEALSRHREPPPVVLTSLTVAGRPVALPRGGDASPAGLVLPPGERSFAFTAAVLDFRHPQRNRSAYRLEGQDEAWVEAGTQAFGAYAHLPVGSYRLRIVGADSDGTWNREGVSLAVEVPPLFHERLALRLLALLLLTGLLATVGVLLYRRRVKGTVRAQADALEGKHRLLEAREEERLHLAQELHDGPLQSLHAVQLELSRRKAPASLAVRDSLQQLVEELRGTCARLRSPLLQPYGLAPAMLDHGERFRHRHPEVDLELDLEPDGQSLAEATRRALFRVFQEALSNAVHHGRARHIRVSLRLGRRTADLTVEDEGVGFEPPARWIELARRGHLGILGMVERAESAGGRVTLRSRPGEGTTVRVTVPRAPSSIKAGSREKAPPPRAAQGTGP